MRKLKCSGCGGALTLVTTGEGHVVGKCGNCGSDHVIDARARQHVVVEHRFAEAGRPANAPAVSGRRRLIGAGLGVAGVLALAPILGRTIFDPTARSPDPQSPFREIFNVGGEGAAPGQFRDTPFDVAVDSLDRVLVRDNGDRYYIFGPDGRFLNNYPRPTGTSGRFVVLLPGGDLIVSDQRRFFRVDMESGEIKETVPAPEEIDEWSNGAAECVTPAGGIALYRVPDSLNPDRRSMGYGTSAPGRDVVIFLDRNLRETRRLSDLLPQAIAADPMINLAAQPVSIAVNGNGSIFIYVIPGDDHDNRTGVFEFNAEGRFQRRIAVTQKFSGSITMAPDDSLWVQDSWMSELQHITAEGVKTCETAGLGRNRGEAPGNIYSVAAYRDGSLAMVGGGRLIRAALVKADHQA